MLEGLTLLALAKNEERGIYHGFKIESPAIMRQVQDYIHSREWPKVWEGNLMGSMAPLSKEDLSELVDPPPGPEPLSEPASSNEPPGEAGLVREMVLAQIKDPTERGATAEGILEMADFKPGDHKCRINTPLGNPILGIFSDAMEAVMQENLRRAVSVQGMATINPHSGRIETMQITGIEPIQSFSVGRDEFFTAHSFADLAAIQEVKPLASINTLSGVFSQSENLDEMLDEIYRERR